MKRGASSHRNSRKVGSYFQGFPGGSVSKESAMWDTWIRSLDREDPLEKGKATHSSILPWRIPGTVYSMGSQRDTTERLSLHSRN